MRQKRHNLTNSQHRKVQGQTTLNKTMENEEAEYNYALWEELWLEENK